MNKGVCLRRKANQRLLAVLLTILLAASLTAQTNPANRSVAITHVTVIDMTGAPPKSDQTVIITGNHIAVLGNNNEVSVPKNSQVIDATGKFLIPGFWDMHAHTIYDRASDTEKTILPLLVANGITGIRNMGSINSLQQINKWRNAAAEGNLITPRIIIGQQVDGLRGIDVSFVYRVKAKLKYAQPFGASSVKASISSRFTAGFLVMNISRSLTKRSD